MADPRKSPVVRAQHAKLRRDVLARRAALAETMAAGGLTLAEAGMRNDMGLTVSSRHWVALRHEFAELVAEGSSLLTAGAALGLSGKAIDCVWGSICARLGEPVHA